MHISGKMAGTIHRHPRNRDYRFLIGIWPVLFSFFILLSSPQGVPVLLAAEKSEIELIAELDNSDTRARYTAATELGRLESVNGLEALIRRGDSTLLKGYLGGFKKGVTRSANTPSLLPESIEKLLVEYFNTKGVAGVVREIARSRNYSSREMLEQKLSVLIKYDDEIDLRQSLLMTDLPDVDRALLDALPQFSESMQGTVLFVLGARGYAPAAEYIANYMVDESGKPRYRTDRTGEKVYSNGSYYRGLATIGTQKSMNLLLSHLGKLKHGGAGEWDYKEVVSLLGYLRDAPDTAPINTDLLRKNTPYLQSSSKVLGQYLGLVKKRGLKPVSDDLYVYLSDSDNQRYVFGTLMSFDDPGIWSKTRSEIERLNKAGKLDTRVYDEMNRELSRRMGDPVKYFAQKRDSELNGEMHREKSKYEVARRNLQRGKDEIGPAQFIDEYRKLLFTMKQLSKKYAGASQVSQINTDIINGYIELGSYTRFKAMLPEQAIGFYKSALPFVENSGYGSDFLINYLIADTYRFDADDVQTALHYYTLALADVETSGAVLPEPWARAMQFWERWLRQEKNYLSDGAVYEGSINRNAVDECGAGISLINLVVSQSEQAVNALFYGGLLDEKTVSANPGGKDALDYIKTIGRSQLLLAEVLKYLPFVDDGMLVEEILQERDPARYLSSCILGSQLHQMTAAIRRFDEDAGKLDAQQKSYAENIAYRYSKTLSFADTFQVRNNIRIQHGIDTRLASPEQTWQLFLDSLRSGDRDGIKMCFSAGMEKKWQRILYTLTDEQLAEMADGISDLTPSMVIDEDTRVYYTQRKQRAGEVWFSKVGGEWLIGEM